MLLKNKKLSFLFIYPPSVAPAVPPLAHSRIKQTVKEHFDALFLDENLEFFYYVVENSISIDGFFVNGNEKENVIGATDGKENVGKSNSSSILKALGILKSNLFFDIKNYVAATAVVEGMLNKFSSKYFPSEIGYSKAKLPYSPYNSPDIVEAIKDNRTNPYVYFFESRIHNYPHADCLGISVIYTSQLIPALTLAYIYKNYYPDSKVILGGPALFRIYNRLKEIFDFIDLIVPYDGEYFFKKCGAAVKEFCDKGIDNGLDSFSECYGFYSIKEALPDFTDVNWDRYIMPQPVVNFDITRGCYYKRCVFCAYGFDVAPYRVVEPGRASLFMKKMRENSGAFAFFFSVDVVDPIYLERLSDNLIKIGAEGIYYYLDARMEDRFREPGFAKKLFKSGCRVVSFGMESACKKTIELMKKGLKVDLFRDVIKNLYNEGIHVNINIIHGFPGDEPEGFKRTLDFLYRNSDNITTVGISEFTLLRGSRMEKDHNKYGIKSIIPEGDLFLYYHTDYVLPKGYPDFNSSVKRMLKLFPVYGRLTGATPEYLLYAIKYPPNQIKLILRRAVEIRSGNI